MTPTKLRLPDNKQRVFFYNTSCDWWEGGMFWAKDEKYPDRFYPNDMIIPVDLCFVSHWMPVPGDPNKTGCALKQTTLVCSRCLEEREDD